MNITELMNKDARANDITVRMDIARQDLAERALLHRRSIFKYTCAAETDVKKMLDRVRQRPEFANPTKVFVGSVED